MFNVLWSIYIAIYIWAYLSNLRLYCTSANIHCSHCYATKYATYLILMFLSVPASSAGAYWWCVYLPLEHFALFVFGHKKKFTKILGFHLNMYQFLEKIHQNHLKLKPNVRGLYQVTQAVNGAALKMLCESFVGSNPTPGTI